MIVSSYSGIVANAVFPLEKVRSGGKRRRLLDSSESSIQKGQGRVMELPIEDSGSSVPVFDCHILISGPDADGNRHGVVSNLPEVTATARSERDLLRKISEQFKSRIIEYRQQNKPIPWEPQRKPATGEQQRWLPVHL